jgi:putative ABC transport system permease protein
LRTLDLLRLIFDNLLRQKGRVALTAVGVVIGTASIVLLVSLANGLQEAAISQFASSGTLTTINVYQGDTSMVNPGAAVSPGATNPSNSRKGLLTGTAITQIASIPGVDAVIPRIGLETYAIIKAGKLENSANVMGVRVEDTKLLNVNIASGSGTLQKGTAIVGGWLIKNFYNSSPRPGVENLPQTADILGKRIHLVISRYTDKGEIKKTVELTVVGVTKEVLSEYDSTFLVNLQDVESWNEWIRGKRINRNLEGYPEVLVKTKSLDSVLPIAEKIKKMGYRSQSPMSFIKQIQNTFTILQLVVGSIGAISLLVAAIGIANTMTMAILERTREIGLMKAIGATNRDILGIFLGEAASIGFIGGAFGAALGWGMGKIFNSVFAGALSGLFPMPTNGSPMQLVNTPIWLLVFAILFSSLIGLISGLYPSIRAAMMQPVVALKYE